MTPPSNSQQLVDFHTTGPKRMGRGATPFWWDRHHLGFRKEAGTTVVWREEYNNSAHDYLIAGPLLQLADIALESVAPRERQEMMHATAPHNRLAGTAFTNFVINATCTDLHRDWFDLGCCVLLFFGPARHLMFPEISLRILVRHGDFVVFPSNALWHCSSLVATEHGGSTPHTATNLFTCVFYCDRHLGHTPLRKGVLGDGFKFLNDKPSTWVQCFESLGRYADSSNSAPESDSQSQSKSDTHTQLQDSDSHSDAKRQTDLCPVPHCRLAEVPATVSCRTCCVFMHASCAARMMSTHVSKLNQSTVVCLECLSEDSELHRTLSANIRLHEASGNVNVNAATEATERRRSDRAMAGVKHPDAELAERNAHRVVVSFADPTIGKPR